MPYSRRYNKDGKLFIINDTAFSNPEGRRVIQVLTYLNDGTVEKVTSWGCIPLCIKVEL